MRSARAFVFLGLSLCGTSCRSGPEVGAARTELHVVNAVMDRIDGELAVTVTNPGPTVILVRSATFDVRVWGERLPTRVVAVTQRVPAHASATVLIPVVLERGDLGHLPPAIPNGPPNKVHVGVRGWLLVEAPSRHAAVAFEYAGQLPHPLPVALRIMRLAPRDRLTLVCQATNPNIFAVESLSGTLAISLGVADARRVTIDLRTLLPAWRKGQTAGLPLEVELDDVLEAAEGEYVDVAIRGELDVRTPWGVMRMTVDLKRSTPLRR